MEDGGRKTWVFEGNLILFLWTEVDCRENIRFLCVIFTYGTTSAAATSPSSSHLSFIFLAGGRGWGNGGREFGRSLMSSGQPMLLSDLPPGRATIWVTWAEQALSWQGAGSQPAGLPCPWVTLGKCHQSQSFWPQVQSSHPFISSSAIKLALLSSLCLVLPFISIGFELRRGGKGCY